MPVPNEVVKLIERFDQNRESYLSGDYKEAQIRTEFIDPFFKTLGWDMNNEQGFAEAYKDVIHEDSIKIGQATKAPDLCFRVGGTRKFFLEAKKPSVNIKEAIEPAYQLRRYAWSSKLYLSILTDFEEFAVYDCRIKPDKNDMAATGRIMYLTYQDYFQKWDEISSIFAKDSILKGSFDKFAEGIKGKKGTASVDDAFLLEIENWREHLAKNIAIRNPILTTRELNFAVQKTIDRIIFLRICEDRGIELYGKIGSFKNGENIYKRLLEYFRTADVRYNSGLFHFQSEKSITEEPDSLTQNIQIEDKVLKEIIGGLYYPESPYEFSVLSSDILGQVYERFLGKVIRLTAGHQAKVEEKPEVRKAGGVYYTPNYIVDYIVGNTVGKLLEDRKVDSKVPLRVADISCGSGSFLIVAYQKLLDWYLKKYTETDLGKWTKGKNPKVRQGGNGEWKLTISERKRILTTHIYGVDIDSQAVEVTKLSLLLKVLEGENEEILNSLHFTDERILPDLGLNIKCGNSLIASDYYENRQGELFDEEEMIRVNAFDWQSQFPQVFKEGGFDAVIGNPPYVRQEALGEEFKTYAKVHYATFAGTADLYTYFIEKGVSLLRDGGLFSYIVANKWMRANYGKTLRVWLKKQCLEEITDFGDLPVFENATTYPCIIRIKKAKPTLEFKTATVVDLKFVSLGKHVQEISFNINKSSLDDRGWALVNQANLNLLEKIKKAGLPLSEYVKGKIYRGVLTGLNEAFVIDEETRKRLIAGDSKSAEIIKPFLMGKDIKRYQCISNDKYLILFPKGWTDMNRGAEKPWDYIIKKYPAVAKYLMPFEEKAKARYDKGNYWWELRECKYYSDFEEPKVLLPDIALRCNCMYDENGGVYCVNTAYFMPIKDKYLIGVLNSKLTTFIYSKMSSTYRGGYLRFIHQYLERIPIVEKPNSEPISSLVSKILELHKKLQKATIPDMKNMLQRQIESTDKEIDRFVYELYELTADEIKIVEGEN